MTSLSPTAGLHQLAIYTRIREINIETLLNLTQVGTRLFSSPDRENCEKMYKFLEIFQRIVGNDYRLVIDMQRDQGKTDLDLRHDEDEINEAVIQLKKNSPETFLHLPQETLLTFTAIQKLYDDIVPSSCTQD